MENDHLVNLYDQNIAQLLCGPWWLQGLVRKTVQLACSHVHAVQALKTNDDDDECVVKAFLLS